MYNNRTLREIFKNPKNNTQDKLGVIFITKIHFVQGTCEATVRKKILIKIIQIKMVIMKIGYKDIRRPECSNETYVKGMTAVRAINFCVQLIKTC